MRKTVRILIVRCVVLLLMISVSSTAVMAAAVDPERYYKPAVTSPVTVKPELEFYGKDALCELTEEMFVMAGEKAKAEGKNCILFDLTTDKAMEGSTHAILKQEWTKHIKADNEYITLMFKWNEGEENFKPAALKGWETNWVGSENEFTICMQGEGYFMGPGRIYPKGLNEQLAEEKEAATQRIIDGVKNTTIKLTSTRGKGYIKLNWKKSAGYKVDYYQVFRSVKRNSDYGRKPFHVTSNGSITSYKNTKSLKAGTRYYFKVRGVRIIHGTNYYTQYSNKVYRTAIK